jgi:NTE family protein
MKMNPKLKWALVLSGGGAKGFAHIGVLKAISALGAPLPSLVAGTSMGAIVGGLYACGMEPDDLARFVLEEFDIRAYMDGFAFKIEGPLGRIVQTGQMLSNLATRQGMDSGERILALLERLTGGKTFEETRIPFRCNAVDLASGREVVFSAGSVARAMRASMSFPAFFEPLREGDSYLVDGGLADNMPVSIARKAGFKRILAVDVINFEPQTGRNFRNGPEIIFRSLETALHILGKEKPPSLIIRVEGTPSVFSFSEGASFIQSGERALREQERAIRGFFGSSLRALLIPRRRIRRPPPGNDAERG